MKVKTIPGAWLSRDGRRLDCGPYMSGALEAKIRLEKMSCRKLRLADLTLGGIEGIFHSGREGRTWVTDPAHGVPFLGSTKILAADLSTLPLISKRQVASNPKFTIHKEWTLITRSGTIGRMAYARPDMDGMACSEDVMRVVPDPAKIPPGYLYAYLSSKFGVPLVTSGTYGAIIQHIEPEHIANLPVPRLGDRLERIIHHRVHEAAELRAEANKLIYTAIRRTLEVWGVEDIQEIPNVHPDIQIVGTNRVAQFSRFDAFYFGTKAISSDATINIISSRLPVFQLGVLVDEIFETTRFGRINVDDPRWGLPFLSISDLVRFDPQSDCLVSRIQVEKLRAVVHSGWLILPRVGQLHGVFGTVCFIPEHLGGVSVSDNNIRICPVDMDTGAYLWAALSTKICYHQIIRRACGTSIPYLDAKRVASIPIPWPSETERLSIALLVRKAMKNRSIATGQEGKARELVERTIEEAN